MDLSFLQNNKKKAFGLVAFLLVAVAIPLTLTLVKQRQEVRKRAFVTPPGGEIELSLTPVSGSILDPNSTVNFIVNIKNITTSSKEIYVAGVDLSYTPAHFNISPASGVQCSNPNLPNAVKNSADPTGSRIYLTCSRTPGSGRLTIGAGQTAPLGTFIAVVTASAGTATSFEFKRGVVPNAVTSVDLAIQPSSPSQYTIRAAPTPTPTNTPIPTATVTPRPTATVTPRPTATNTPVPTATSTPVPTATSTPRPTATSTPRPTATNTPIPTATPTPRPTATGTPVPTATPTPRPPIAGDLDGDGYVGESDLTMMLACWTPSGSVSSGCHIADIDGVGGVADGRVDEIDLTTLLRNWNPPTQ